MMDVFEQMWEQKWQFFATFFVVVAVTYLVLLALDFYPEPVTEEVVEDINATVSLQDEVELMDESSATATEAAVLPAPVEVTDVAIASHTEEAVMPVRVEIPRLDKTLTVLNPASRTVADLDAALLNGVVRHPDSAALNQEGNVFILGHSSYLPNVFNKNFQAFNGIQELEWGDTILLYSHNTAYEYRIDRVYRARAQDVTVPIAGSEHKLTLATCNSFGSVDDRYIVEATLIATERV